MREQIFLSKNFTVIESDIPFTLKFNIKDNTAASAEDVINFKSGWYIFDNNKLLPQYVDGVYNLPKYNCWIEYNILPGGTKPHWYTCYINPKSVESLSAESTELDSAQLAILRQDIQINGAKVDAVKTSVDAVKTSVDAVKTSVDAVKTSVDAVKTANHADLSAVKTSVDALTVINRDGFSAVLDEFVRADFIKLSKFPFSFLSENFFRLFLFNGQQREYAIDFWFFSPVNYDRDCHVFVSGTSYEHWFVIPHDDKCRFSFRITGEMHTNLQFEFHANKSDITHTFDMGAFWGLFLDFVCEVSGVVDVVDSTIVLN